MLLCKQSLFNNGNYRPHNKDASVTASQNAFRSTHSQSTLSTKQIRKLVEYGGTEFGSEGDNSTSPPPHLISKREN
jgi:hypothetical protein